MIGDPQNSRDPIGSEEAHRDGPEGNSEEVSENDRWLRIGALFDEALEQPPGERSSWLEEACPGDPEVRREVESMLSAHDRAEGILEHSVPPLASTLAELTGRGLSALDGLSHLGDGRSVPVPGEDLTGRQVGPYRLLREVGRGGMGVVYQARDSRLDRDVALKFLPASMAASREGQARFLAEARAASALDHPAICTLFDLGETEDGRLYIVMAYYPGQTLADRLAEGPLPLDLALKLARGVAEGLGRAHEAGILHRDIKPSNLLITERDEVKILDFGIAKLEGGMTLTRSGALMGTLAYMSPEQFSGAELDARSDLWSLGAVLYEMIAGCRPFQAPTPAATMESILEREPAALRELRPELPAAVAGVVHRLLAKEPERRYSSAAELVDDLRALEEEITVPDRARRARSRVPSRLPVPLTRFVGREDEVGRVWELLSKARLVTLTGPGGTGKTRLALEVARRAGSDFPDGAHFVSLSGVAAPDLVVSAIASALEVTVAPERSLLESIQQSVGECRMLLVLDNFEHVVKAAPDVAELLMGCRELKILVTSRVALRLSAERELPVPPLALPSVPLNEGWDGTDPESLSGAAAVELFVERAAAVQPDFQLTERNAGAVAEIAVRLDGLPLAIELAAARVKLFPPRALLERLKAGLDLLSGGARDLPDRHRTLRRALNWSYELLEDEEQRFFRRVAVLVDEFSLEAAEAVCSDLSLDVTEGLAVLVEQSLLQQKEGRDGEPRFSLLETVRTFGLEKLEEAGEDDAGRRAHARWCLELAERAEPELTGSDQGVWLDRLEENHGNLRAALDWTQREREIETGLRLGVALWRFWLARGHLEEGTARFERLLELPEEGGPSRLRALALNGLGTLFHNRGRNEEAHTFLSGSLALFRYLDEPSGVALVLNNLGWVACELSELHKARQLSEEALALHRELGDRRGIALALNNLGWVANYEGDTRAACRFHRQSLELRREIGDLRGIAFALGNLAWAEQLRGDRDSAAERLEEAWELVSGVEDRLMQGFVRILQAWILRDRGETEGAVEALERGLVLWRRSGNRSGVAWTQTDLGHLLIDLGRLEEAGKCFDEALALCRSIGGRWGEARTLLGQARLAHAENRREIAWSLLRQSLDRFCELGAWGAVPRALEVGAAWLAELDADRAVRVLAAAEALRERCESPLSPRLREDREALEAELRRALGEETCADLHEEGRQMEPVAAKDLLLARSP